MDARLRSTMLLLVLAAWLSASGCASLAARDPLSITVAGIEPLPSEGLEVRFAVRVRIQNPNDAPIDYSGAALRLELNGRRLASGVSDVVGTVPRYGEAVLTIPVTISVLDVVWQALGLANAAEQRDVRYRVRGKLEAGVLGSRRFSSEGMFELPPAR